MITLENTKLAIIGLGYVGLPLAVEFGKKMPVIGFDINEPRVDELRSGTDNTLVESDDNTISGTNNSVKDSHGNKISGNGNIVR